MATNSLRKALVIGALIPAAIIGLSNTCQAAESDDVFSIIKPETKSQLWINPGMVSYHFQQDKNFNNGNWGGGLDYRFNTVPQSLPDAFIAVIALTQITPASTISQLRLALLN